MKYKIFYKDEEVAEFNVMKEAIEYINKMLDTDKSLQREDFYCYMLLS